MPSRPASLHSTRVRMSIKFATLILVPFLLWGSGTVEYRIHHSPSPHWLQLFWSVGLTFIVVLVAAAITTWGWSTKHSTGEIEHPGLRFFVSTAVDTAAVIAVSVWPIMALQMNQQDPFAWLLLICAGLLACTLVPVPKPRR